MLINSLSQYKFHITRNIQLAIPIIIGQLGHMGLGVVDNIMIGQLGPVPLAASSLANAVFIQFMIFGLGVSLALSPLLAASNEAGNELECSLLLNHSLLINMGLALLTVGLIYGVSFFIPYLGQEKDVVDYTIPYLNILIWSYIPFAFFQTYRQFCDGLSFVKPAMYIMVAAVAINASFNWLLIYGHWGFPRLELRGAAIATLVTRLFTALAIWLYVLRSKRFTRFHPGKWFIAFNKSILKKLLYVGVPGGLQGFLEIGAFASVAFIIGWLGAYDLAAHQIALNLASVTFMFALGISSAASIRVGAEFGKGTKGDVRGAGFGAVILSALVMGINGLIFIIFRDQLVALYINQVAVQSIAAQLLIIAALFQVFDGIQAVGIGILRGLTDVKIPTLITFIAYWILSIPIGYLFGIVLGLGVNGIWYGFVSGLGSAAIMLTLRFWYKTRNPAVGV